MSASRAVRDAATEFIGYFGRNGVRLFLTSATLLFVELLLIRWIPANVLYVGFFRNFLLMASFLGIGLGIMAGRRFGSIGLVPFSLILLLITAVVLSVQLNVQIESRTELVFGVAINHSADINALVLPVVFALVTTAMAALALPLGGLLRSMPPLRAYSIDIAGSMTGIAVFTAISSASTDPIVWFGFVGVLVTLLSLGRRATWRSVVAPLALAVVVILAGRSYQAGDIWSPYYRISTYESSCGITNVNVDGIPHQAIHPVTDPNVACAKEPFYEQTYDWFPGRRLQDVLVVGAGTGSDVALALAHGAEHVDAVEIDPAIQQIGAARHPDRPYSDPRVSVYVDDGRAFMRTSRSRYDLIVLAQTDSLTLVSSAANLRLESFLLTNEGLASARDHLSADGIFVLYDYYREPWLLEKLGGMLHDAFGADPVFRSYSGIYAVFAAGPGTAGGVPTTAMALPTADGPAPTPATDDWPFLYLRAPDVAPYYLAALAFVLAVALAAVRFVGVVTHESMSRISPHFFVLGAAFLLLETRSLVTFSLLFGTTWSVNALTFFAILGSVLVAILVTRLRPVVRTARLYVALFGALALALLLPPQALLVDPPWVRFILVATVSFAPIFLANLVFTRSFRDSRTADMAFASNLLGAMVGGVFEYAALITGYRALLIVIAVLYFLAWLLGSQVRLMADVDLADATV